MRIVFQRYATPFITGLFLVSLFSGIALFFHVGPGAFHGMHEWLSMVLILPFLLHVWKNWRPFSSYFRRAPMAIALLVSLAASAYYFIPSAPSERAGGPPQFAFASKILSNSLGEVAPLLGLPDEGLVNKLRSAGFSAAAVDLPLAEIATRSGKGQGELIRNLLSEAHATDDGK